MDSKATIYSTKENCPGCLKAKDLFNKLKVSFEEILLSQDPVRFQKAIDETNARISPLILINGVWIIGYNAHKIIEAL